MMVLVVFCIESGECECNVLIEDFIYIVRKYVQGDNVDYIVVWCLVSSEGCKVFDLVGVEVDFDLLLVVIRLC